MKTRLIICLSVALNVAFATAIFLPVKKTSLPVHGPPATASVSAAMPQPPAHADVFTSLPFRWSEIVSENLKIYRDNLRAIGCPESTVREIIRAVINENFGARRRNILTSSQDRYWDMVLRGELIGRQTIPQAEWARRLAALGDERKQLIADVFGRGALADEVGQQTQLAELEQRRSWLTSDKRGRLMELEEKYQRRLAEWGAALKSRNDGTPTSDDEARLQEWRKEFEEAEMRVLTPEELAELKLRESDVADWATSLPGLNPTEDEWRTLTELRSQLEKSQGAIAASPDSTSDERTARQNELQADFDDAVKSALGSNRFEQYQLANNDRYQAIHNVTQRYSLSESTAAESLGVQRTAEIQAEQVRANSNLSPEAQQKALDAIQQETERTLDQILGPKVLSTYKEYGGDWILELNR